MERASARLARVHSELRQRLSTASERQAWLAHARRTRVWLAVVIVLGVFVMPALSGSLADTVFEPKRSRRLFSREVRRDPRAESLQWLLELGFWVVGLGLVAREAWRERPPLGAPAAAPGADAGFGELATLPPTAPPDNDTRALAAAATLGPSTAAAPRYRLDAELGRGGMGVVYRATDTVLDRAVALKSIPAELLAHPELVARFEREAKVVAGLGHPHIVAVYDLVRQDGRLYMAMELVEGRDLAAQIATGPLPQTRAVEIALQVASALAHAHAQGVIHRDFKPDNVLLTAAGVAKVTDFGIAKAQDGPRVTQTGAVMGTPHYMSPEQASGTEVDWRTDAYALGVTLYEMLAGAPPFSGNTGQLLVQHLTEEPPPLDERVSGLDPQLVALVHALLRKDPAERPESMRGVVASLEALAVALSA